MGGRARCFRLRPGLVVAALLGAVGCGAGVAGEARTGATAPGAGGRIHTITMVLPVVAAGTGGGRAGAAAPADSAGATAFEALVESLSMGRIAVEVDAGGGRCDGPAACLAALRAGTIDIYRSTAPDAGRILPAVHVLDVPYLLETDEVVEWVFRGSFFARTRDALLHRTGLRLMALGSAGGWRGIATTTRVVRTPADVRGLTLRTADSPVEIEWARALGALPAPGPWSELASALASGQVEGATDGLIAIVGAGLHHRLPYLTQDRHGYRAALWLMNEEAYQALPADLQQLLRAGFDELGRLSLARARERTAEAIAAFEAAGGQVHTPSAAERRAFVMAAGRVSTWYMREYGHEWLVWLEGAIAEAERAIALAESARP